MVVTGWPMTAISIGSFVTYELGVDACLGHRRVVSTASHNVIILRYDLEAWACTSLFRANYGLAIAKRGLELGAIVVHHVVEAQVVSYLSRMVVI